MSFAAAAATGKTTEESHGLARLSLILLAILAARFVLLALAELDLAYDEAQYWLWSQELAAGYYSKPPLIAWLIRGATEICGDATACLRAPAPVVHILAAVFIYAIGRRLYDARVGFWSAILYATMPGVAVSSLVITTDAPLLLCWSAALLVLIAQIERPRILTALTLGLVVGLGLNAKFAMIYIVMCAALYGAFTPSARPALLAPSTLLALAVALLAIVPNLLWNIDNGFETFLHTGENIGLGAFGFDPVEALEFLGGQLAIAGPLVLGAAFAALVTGRRTGRPGADRLLLFFSMPIIGLILAKAFLGDSSGNWSATAYPAVVVLATAHFLAAGARRLLLASLAFNIVASAGVAAGALFADHPIIANSYASGSRMVGWPELAARVEALAKAEGVDTVVGYSKPMVAELVYYLRDSGLQVRAYRAPDARPQDHFEMTRPWHESTATGGPVLFVPPIHSRWPLKGVDRAILIRVAQIESSTYLAQGGHLRLYRIEPRR